MPAAATHDLPIRYSRMETLEAHTSYLRASIAYSRAALRGGERVRQVQRLAPPCGEAEMRLALAEVKRLGRMGRRVTFDEALEALRAGYR